MKQKDPIMLDEAFFRNVFSSFGIIEGVTIDKNKAYVMFRYRDSALKALRLLTENAVDGDERSTLLKDFNLKIVSTSAA